MSVSQARSSHHIAAYRADIDGLRAIAVLAVVLFHAEFGFARGGFLGVDVFFVISGYLIGGIIFRGLDQGRFSLIEFYVRRVNRILPALITVMLATAALGWLFLYYQEFDQLGKHMAGGATFLSNFILWKEFGYFDLPAKPLLHLWSLAVEEQFYLLFPAIALIGLTSRRHRAPALAVLMFASFLLNVWDVRHSQQNSAFFLPQARMWEILAGVLLVTLEAGPLSKSGLLAADGRLRKFAPLVGIAMLIGAIAYINESMPWPGMLAAIPVIATVFLIIGHYGVINQRVLSHPWLVGIGLISYPLYLWHWPLLVFGKLINEGAAPLLQRWGLVALSFVLAIMTFELIEKPIRFGSHKRRSAALLLPVLASVGLLGHLINRQHIFARLDTHKIRAIRAKTAEPEIPPDGTVRGGLAYLYSRLPGDSVRIVALIGDSHMQQYWPRFVELRNHSDSGFPEVTMFAYGGCPFLPGVNRVGISWDNNPWDCPAFLRTAMGFASRPEVKAVVFSSFLEDYFLRGLLIPEGSADHRYLGEDDPRLGVIWKSFETAVGNLVASGKRVYLILPGPVLRRFAPTDSYDEIPARLSGLFGGKIPTDSIDKARFLVFSSRERQYMKDVADRTGAEIIDPVAFLCGEVRCATVSADGLPIFRDDHHLRPGFVRTHVTYLDRVVQK